MSTTPLSALTPQSPATTAPAITASAAKASAAYATVYEHTTLVRAMTTENFITIYTHDFLLPRAAGYGAENGYFRIDSEIVAVIGYDRPGTWGADPNFATYLVTRGWFQTPVTTHAAGALVSWVSPAEIAALSSHRPIPPTPTPPSPAPSPVAAKYQQLGGATGFLGPAVSGEIDLPAIPGVRAAGKYQAFRYGSIYWSAATGAHEVHGAIRDRWVAYGAERSVLGYPTTDELAAGDGRGRYSQFQGGTVYWTPQTGAHEVHGAIRDKWASLGGVRSLLGYPISDELAAADGRGRYSVFQNGVVYWTPQTGAHEVHGAIRSLWVAYGAERGVLGYPKSDEYTWNGGRRSDFQGGFIFWTPQTGARAYRY
jgi:uncharacterized protein with LGFP repeats